MDTYHGFDYNTDYFDKTKALEYVLNHYVFMDANDRPVDLQHSFITEASNVVDEIEQSYKLWREYERLRASTSKIIGLSLIIFAIGLVMVLSDFLSFSSNVGPANVILTAIMGICLIAPVTILACSLCMASRDTTTILTEIHDTEMKITIMLTFAAQQNTISMVEQRLDTQTSYKPPQKTLN